jgi:hypothetical protein
MMRHRARVLAALEDGGADSKGGDGGAGEEGEADGAVVAQDLRGDEGGWAMRVSRHQRIAAILARTDASAGRGESKINVERTWLMRGQHSGAGPFQRQP